MSEIITSSGGVVDKFIGDSLMCFWNAPNRIRSHPSVACEAAILSQQKLAALRESNSLFDF